MSAINDVTWYVFGLMLTAGGLMWSYLRYQKKGLAAGVRGVAWSLIPMALALTGSLELAGELLDEIGRFALNLAFSPLVWVGLVLGGLSAALFVVSGWMGSRTAKHRSGSDELPATPGRAPAVPVDDDLADIEAILRKHGIQ